MRTENIASSNPMCSTFNDLEDEVDIMMTVNGDFDKYGDEKIANYVEQLENSSAVVKENDEVEDGWEDEIKFDDEDDEEEEARLGTDYSEVGDNPDLVNSDVNGNIAGERDIFWGRDEDGELIDIVNNTFDPDDGPAEGDSRVDTEDDDGENVDPDDEDDDIKD